MEVIKLFGDLAERGIFCDPGIGEDDIEPAFVLFNEVNLAFFLCTDLQESITIGVLVTYICAVMHHFAPIARPNVGSNGVGHAA